MKSDRINKNQNKTTKQVYLPYFTNDKQTHKASKSALYQRNNSIFKVSPKEKHTIYPYASRGEKERKRIIKASSFEEFKAKAKSICHLNITDNLHNKKEIFLKNFSTFSCGTASETIIQPSIMSNSFRKCFYFDKKFHLKEMLERKYKYCCLFEGHVKKDGSFNLNNDRMRILSSTPQRKIRIQFSNEYIKELIEKNN